MAQFSDSSFHLHNAFEIIFEKLADFSTVHGVM